jgi:hypothetical protein
MVPSVIYISFMLPPFSLLLFPFISIVARQSLIGKNAPMFREILSTSGAMLSGTLLVCLNQSKLNSKKFQLWLNSEKFLANTIKGCTSMKPSVSQFSTGPNWNSI